MLNLKLLNIIDSFLLKVGSITYIVNIGEALKNKGQQLKVMRFLFDIQNDGSDFVRRKLNMIEFKVWILMSFLLAIIILYSMGIVHRISYETPVLFYLHSFLLIRSTEFLVIVDIFKIKIQILHKELDQIIDAPMLISPDLDNVNLSRKKIDNIRSRYVAVKDINIMLNDGAIWSMCCIACMFVLFLICVSYYLLLGVFKGTVIITYTRK